MIEFGSGELFISNKDGSYSKLMDIQSINELDVDENNDIMSCNNRVIDLSRPIEMTFNVDISDVKIKKINGILFYGWKAKGPIRKKGLLVALRLFRKEVN